VSFDLWWLRGFSSLLGWEVMTLSRVLPYWCAVWWGVGREVAASLPFVYALRSILRALDMWRDTTWVGRGSMPCLGYDVWPLAGPVSSCWVWRWVVSEFVQFSPCIQLLLPRSWAYSSSLQRGGVLSVNRLTAKSVLAGTKNSPSEGFLLAKHTAHKHPHQQDDVYVGIHPTPMGASAEGARWGHLKLLITWVSNLFLLPLRWWQY
jgi:hypothetical protein